jgi:hypothetical protein
MREFGDHIPPDETVVFLAAPDELELCWLVSRLRERDVFHATFREPDLDDSLTAVAIGRGGASACRKYPLALRGIFLNRPLAISTHDLDDYYASQEEN